MIRIYSSEHACAGNDMFVCDITNAGRQVAIMQALLVRSQITKSFNIVSVNCANFSLSPLEYAEEMQKFISRLCSYITSPRTLAYMNSAPESELPL